MLFTQTQRKKRTSYFERKIGIFMNTQTKHILPKKQARGPQGSSVVVTVVHERCMHSKEGTSTEILPFLGCFIQVPDGEFRLPSFERWRARGLSARNLKSCCGLFSASFKWKTWGALIHQLLLRNYVLRTMILQADAINQQLQRFTVPLISTIVAISQLYLSIFIEKKNRLHKLIHYSFSHLLYSLMKLVFSSSREDAHYLSHILAFEPLKSMVQCQ